MIHAKTLSVDFCGIADRQRWRGADIVHKQMNEGKTIEDIKKAGLPEAWRRSWPFISQDKWLEIVYNSLKKEMTAK
ncbi:MAG TPA: hypothetical protein VGA99_02350 [bacterium]